jgi:hypothetical protein
MTADEEPKRGGTPAAALWILVTVTILLATIAAVIVAGKALSEEPAPLEDGPTDSLVG